jgi:hypothetical protein
MAYYSSLEALFTDIAGAIKEKDTTLSNIQASNFHTTIRFHLSGKWIEDGLVSGKGITYYENDRIAHIKEGAFKNSEIEEARLGNDYTTVNYGEEAFKGSMLKSFTHAPSNTNEKNGNGAIFKAQCFADCENLTIVRLNTANNASTTFEEDTFLNTPIANKTGYIYVPSKHLSNFQTSYPQYNFRSIQSYTVDGTLFGELDLNKVAITGVNEE